MDRPLPRGQSCDVQNGRDDVDIELGALAEASTVLQPATPQQLDRDGWAGNGCIQQLQQRLKVAVLSRHICEKSTYTDTYMREIALGSSINAISSQVICA